MGKLILSLNQLKKRNNSDIVVAALVLDEEKILIVKSYFSPPQISDNPLDTPITNLILHACQGGYDSKLFIASTCKPTIFEREAINIMGIDKIGYLNSEEEFVLLTQKKRKLREATVKIKNPIVESYIIDSVKQAIEKEGVKANNKGQLHTHGAFLWCEDLRTVKCPQPVQDELYLGLLYSSLFILWNGTARPTDFLGRMPVAAMLVDGDNRPIAFSINTSLADNSIAHAETGMLLRYFNNKKTTKLPARSKLYTTLESCEMCRAGLSLVKDEKTEFKELYGKKDERVRCEEYHGYSLSPHEAINKYLKDINLKQGESFFNFCKTNYLAIKSFIEQENLKLRYPDLFENIKFIWDRLIDMRMYPWVGNPIFYDLQDDPTNPANFIATPKPKCEELYRAYYGEDISQLIIQEKTIYSKGLTVMQGNSLNVGDQIYLGSGRIIIKNSVVSSKRPINLSVPKDEAKRQLATRTGFPMNEKKLIGEYRSSEQDENLKEKLFRNTITSLKSALTLLQELIKEIEGLPTVPDNKDFSPYLSLSKKEIRIGAVPSSTIAQSITTTTTSPPTVSPPMPTATSAGVASVHQQGTQSLGNIQVDRAKPLSPSSISTLLSQGQEKLVEI